MTGTGRRAVRSAALPRGKAEPALAIARDGIGKLKKDLTNNLLYGFNIPNRKSVAHRHG